MQGLIFRVAYALQVRAKKHKDFTLPPLFTLAEYVIAEKSLATVCQREPFRCFLTLAGTPACIYSPLRGLIHALLTCSFFGLLASRVEGHSLLPCDVGIIALPLKKVKHFLKLFCTFFHFFYKSLIINAL